MSERNEWSDTDIELLAKLWNEGLSAHQIAQQLSGSHTRNAVIGKVHRMKLGKRPNVKKHAALQRRVALGENPKAGQQGGLARKLGRAKAAGAASIKEAIAPRTAAADADAETPFRAEPIVEAKEPEGLILGLGVIDLGDHVCRWPHGDPKEAGFGFCGQPTPRVADVKGRLIPKPPYCEFHRRRAHGASADKRGPRP